MKANEPRYGRDRRRRLSPDEARFLYERANGRCQRCGVALDAKWHGAHLTSHTHGGATNVGQMEAWCWRCNLRLGPNDAENAPVFTPRLWQREGLTRILEDIYQYGVATLHAAPGAGKTYEAAWVFKQLHDAGIATRLLVVVPSLPLVDQWVQEVGVLGIHLDKTPRDGVIEHPDTVGAVVCYASTPNTADDHAIRMDQIPTLVVWDEVHHLAEKASWGRAARTMVGDVANGGIEHAAAVLNSTGTLFRSSKTQRIATVRYQPVATDEGEKIQALASYSVTTPELVGVELRPPDLYVYSGKAQLIELRTKEVITGEIADLDKQQRQAVMRDYPRTWVRGFCQEAWMLLQRQLVAIEDKEPLKLLYIAKGIREARIAADVLNEITDRDFSRLIVNDEPGSRHRLAAAKRERRSCAIVAVYMVTEGFDCDHIATTAYASNITAPLFIAQAMARNMRVTRTERASGRMLPAQTLIPDNPDLRKAFAAALANAVHEVEEEDHCRRCGLPVADCRCEKPPPPPPSLPRYALLALDDPRLRSAVVLGHADGETNGRELQERWVPVCDELGIPGTYAPRVATASRRVRPATHRYSESESEPEPAGNVRTETANPRDVNLVYRAALTKAARWMYVHVEHDEQFSTVNAFQTAANKEARIPFDDDGKGMRDQASADQLRIAAEWMREQVTDHCGTYGCTPPQWLTGDDKQ
jgi:superfamily II DNA or RNA helicase